MQRQGATGNKEMFTAQGSHISSTHMPSTLEPKRSVSLTSGVPDTVVKNKKIYFSSTAVIHNNYTENISLTEQFEH